MRIEKSHPPANAPVFQVPLLGIDVGGSKISGGLVSHLGEVLFEHRIPTRPHYLLEDLVDVARVIVDRAGSGARSIGVGMTGYIDRTNGVLIQSMNMGIREIPIAQALADATAMSIYVENDVHAATIGEIHFGAGRSYKDFLVFNAGTGLATGMVFNGKLHRGVSNYAGESGHISADQSGSTLCRCGLSGCTETLLLEARAGADTAPAYLPQIEPPARREYGYLVLSLIQLVNLLNPAAIVLAGGMFTADPVATDWVRRAVRAHALPNALSGLREMELSRTAPFTGLVGAAALAIEAHVSDRSEFVTMPTEMLKFILEQPEALKRLLAAELNEDELAVPFRERKIRKVWIAGSGTSLYAAMIAARSWERELGIDCEAVSSLEFLDETETGGLGADTMVLAISQSGASLILLEGVRRANAAGAITAVVTADPEAPISLESGFVIETHTGPETNLGKTKGFTTTAFAAILWGGVSPWGPLPMHQRPCKPGTPDCRLLLRPRSKQAGRSHASGPIDFARSDALFVVGAGSQVPTALEGALKILEVAKMPVISKELEEMMHGPFNGVSAATGIVLAADESAQSQRLSAFVKGVKLIGTPFASLAAGQAVADRHGPFDLVLPPCEDEAARAVLGVVPFQLLAHDLAAARGAPIDTARYPQLYPVFKSKSIHK